jgi:cellulose synthase/poly-beta-1,6-N-acetylglucosamine synthase-like glycosyltransferase
LPCFHILIAAYEASDSLGPVIRATAKQNYPHDKYHTWIISECGEKKRKAKLAEQIVRDSHKEYNSLTTSAKSLLFWHAVRSGIKTIDQWVEELTQGNLRTYLHLPDAPAIILETLIKLIFQSTQPEYEFSILNTILKQQELSIVKDEIQQINHFVERISKDFSRLLGSDQIIRREDISSEAIGTAIRKRKLRTIGIHLCKRLALYGTPKNTLPKEWFESNHIPIFTSTQSVTEQLIIDHRDTNIHLLDPENRGFKPGALNYAYNYIRDRGLINQPENTYFLIIDADSLLPVNALSKTASEIVKHNPCNSIMQMVSIPTANFFFKGWFSKFISIADSIGAVGKWARSTRRQLKPDLHAGSGVVIPAPLLEFIMTVEGKPWDTSTLTEDARIIIGQFGTMNRALNKTQMIPVYLLEAVPNQSTFWGTYKSFWNQRRRWTTGGYDEFYYLLFRSNSFLHTHYDRDTAKWISEKQNDLFEWLPKLRQTWRLLQWLWDHFLWGIGGFIILTHWTLVSILITKPSPLICWAGLGSLILTPLLFLLIPLREIKWYIPDNVSKRRMLLLYVQCFVGIWLYALPVVCTQLCCILGFRKGFSEWKPTSKPRYSGTLKIKEEL